MPTSAIFRRIREKPPQTVPAAACAASGDSVARHAQYRGKVQLVPKCPIRSVADFSVWYTPGVADACRAIAAARERAFDVTNRGNSIAIVSDGTRVLGLGDIGPEAALPVMEGKSLLFKYLGGVDAVPLCVSAREPEAFVELVRALEPSFGGINLEDIEQPKCFDVLERLRSSMTIPVWHDDQQGTAAVVLAALTNALEVVGKRLDRVRIAMVGIGAATVATYRLLRAAGIDAAELVACDKMGTLHRGRADVAEASPASWKWRMCRETNARGVVGGIADALRGADVCIAFSAPGPGVIEPEWVRTMADDAVVFACANPVPEIWPEDAARAGAAIVATGRSDFPNQVNNALAFPGIFRGVLDVRASAITDEMAIAAARALARYAAETGLSRDRIVPSIDDEEVAVREAVAVGRAAVDAGLARLPRTAEQLAASARAAIETSRAALDALTRAGLVT
jgi:malate dehydrogenase (oxaloacetate-decarboxylating)